MSGNNQLISQEDIEAQVIEIRGQKVILDSDLARIYDVATKRLNEQVKRNADRFPADFAFKLDPEEAAISKSRKAASIDSGNRSQFATGSQRHRDPRYLPWAFTEHGAIMAATVLNSPRAVQMSVFVVRAFVKMRRMMIVQRDLSKKLAEIEKKLTARLDVHETAIVEVLRQMMTLLTPPPDEPESPRRQIGFGMR
jgi:hypothetical protein